MVAPFLGQVRLAQANDPASVYEEQIRTLANNARELPDAAALLQHATACYAQAASLRQYPTPQTEADVEKCVRDFRSKVERAIDEADRLPAVPAPAGGVPTWTYVAAGLAAVGLVSWLASRK